jgi:phospholipase C
MQTSSSNNHAPARFLVAAVTAILLAGCSAGVTGGPFPLSGRSSATAMSQALVQRSGSMRDAKIQHVVIIVQENRSFDDLFHGFPGADTQSYGYTSTGSKVALEPVSLDTKWDIDHSSTSFFAACDGHGSLPGTGCKMDGFDKESTTCGGGRGYPRCPNRHPQYGYVPASESKPYFAMAQRYVLADRMFTSNFDAASFVSHQYAIAGQASSSVDSPSGPWGCDGGPADLIRTVTQQRAYGPSIQACYDNTTLGDELDAARRSWRYYATDLGGDGGIWSAYQAIKHIRYGLDWKADVVSPQTRFFADVRNRRLPAVSWVTPTCENSDHAGCGSNHGPQWVASLVNAIGTSAYWKSTVVFVFWDDYGGWYDHVAPPLEDYDGLGLRVPLLILSAYAKQGYVSHVQYEHGSILRFVEDRFGLPRLGASDSRANSPEKDCFDFTQPPRAFVAIPTSLKESNFENEPVDRRVPDGE